MTHTELVLLLSGIAIGVDLAVATHFGLQIADNRRERRRQAEAVASQAAATSGGRLTADDMNAVRSAGLPPGTVITSDAIREARKCRAEKTTQP